MGGQGAREVITITLAARRTGLAASSVRRYVHRGLIKAPLEESELVTLRRIRRLTDLGINLAGVEVILRLRQRVEELQVEVAQLETLLGLRVPGTQRNQSDHTKVHSKEYGGLF